MRKFSVFIIVGSVLTIVPGCLSPQKNYETSKAKIQKDIAPRLVKNRAAFDFGCEPEKIVITQIAEFDFGATGCNQKSVYKINCSLNLMTDEVKDEQCTAIRN